MAVRLAGAGKRSVILEDSDISDTAVACGRVCHVPPHTHNVVHVALVGVGHVTDMFHGFDDNIMISKTFGDEELPNLSLLEHDTGETLIDCRSDVRNNPDTPARIVGSGFRIRPICFDFRRGQVFTSRAKWTICPANDFLVET